MPTQPLLDLRYVLLVPSGRSWNDQPVRPRTQRLFEISEADAIATIPAHGPKDDLALKTAPLEASYLQLPLRSAALSLAAPIFATESINVPFEMTPPFRTEIGLVSKSPGGPD